MDAQNRPDLDASAPDIPSLKKKEEEERRKGAGWFTRSGPGSTFRIGAGGSGVRSGLMGSLERIAQSMARSLGVNSALGRVLMSRAGAWLVLGAACAPAALFLAAGILGSPGASIRYSAASAPMTAVIQAPRSALTAPAGGGALDMLSKANPGGLGESSPSVDAPAAAAASETKAEAPAADAAPAPAQPGAEIAGILGNKGLSREGFVQKLSGGVGGSGSSARLSDTGIQMKLANNFKDSMGGRGKLSAISRPSRTAANRRLSAVRGKSNRAVGQLKLADKLSRAGASAGGDASRQYAADAFDQQRSQGPGTEGGGVGNSNPVTTPSGGGAPDVTGEAPAVGPGGNVTPYQDQLDNAKSNTSSALMLAIIGALLLAIGGYLAYQQPFEYAREIGIAIIAVGVVVIAMGMMMSKAAKGQGQQIKDQFGQQEQGRVVDECADQATNKQNCNPTPIDQKPNTTQNDAALERNATYDNGGPVQ